MISDIYQLEDKGSDSVVQFQLKINEHMKVKLHNLQMLRGNVISLANIKTAINHFQDSIEMEGNQVS